jgi:hypothetical protein
LLGKEMKVADEIGQLKKEANVVHTKQALK